MTAGGAIPPAFLRSNIRIIQMTQLITKTYEAIRDTMRFYRTVHELTQLNDRELADLGLTRGDICHVAANATLKG